LVNALNRYFPDKSKSLIMATMGDKDITGSLSELKNVLKLNKIYTVSVKDNPRAMAADKLCDIIKNAGFTSTPCQSITEALGLSSDDMTVICGSLYLYKDYNDEAR